jgi:hypothetical protein
MVVLRCPQVACQFQTPSRFTAEGVIPGIRGKKGFRHVIELDVGKQLEESIQERSEELRP